MHPEYGLCENVAACNYSYCVNKFTTGKSYARELLPPLLSQCPLLPDWQILKDDLCAVFWPHKNFHQSNNTLLLLPISRCPVLSDWWILTDDLCAIFDLTTFISHSTLSSRAGVLLMGRTKYLCKAVPYECSSPIFLLYVILTTLWISSCPNTACTGSTYPC